MILFHNVVEILDLTDGDGGAVLLIIALDGRFIGRTPVDGDLLRHAMAADRLGQEPLRSLLIALFRQQEINGRARLIDGTIEVIPLAFHLNIRLVHAPADPHRTLTPVKRLFQQGAVFHDPALDGGVVDRDSALLQEFFDMTVAQGIRHIPTHTHEDDIRWEMGPFETDCHCRAPSWCPVGHGGRSYRKWPQMQLCDKTVFYPPGESEIHVAGVTPHPNAVWMVQVARRKSLRVRH